MTQASHSPLRQALARPARAGAALARRARAFLRDEAGSSTIEFTIFVPSFLFLFLSSFESGMMMVRQVMLDRALDQTVRNVRIGAFDSLKPEEVYDALKDFMCARRTNIANCQNELKLEMRQVDPRDWAVSLGAFQARPQCVNRADPDSVPATNFTPGVENQLMLLRVCQLFDPFFPTIGLGSILAQGDGYYALAATSAYVIEPQN